MDYKTKILLTYNSKYIINNNIFIISLLLTIIIIIYYAGYKYKYVNKWFLLTLFLYHTLISLFFYYYTLHGWADCRGFYLSAVESGNINILETYGVGHQFIYFILYPFIHYAKLTYLSCTLLFNFLGLLGLLFLYIALGSLAEHSKNAMKYLHLTLFIPTLSYFTGFIGKDPLIFLSSCLLLFSLLNLRSRYLLFLIALGLMWVVRPYICLIVLSSLFIALLFTGKMNFVLKIVSIIILVIVTFFAANLFLEESGVDKVSDADKLILSQQGVWGGGSDVDISHYNIVFKILTFLYRPLFIDAHNIMSLLSSCENIIYIYLTFVIFSPKFCQYLLREKTFFMRYNYFYIFIGTFLMSQANANLGTIVRKKVMIVPSIIALIILYIGHKDKLVNKGD